MSRALSLPHEHGGYLTIAGAAVAGVALAQVRGPAIAAGAVTAAAFFARAPIEQLARGRGARWDVVAVAALGTVVLVAALALGGAWAAAAFGVAAVMVSASALARSARAQRSTWFETVGMAALGASAGVIATAGGAGVRLGAVLAIAMGAHAGLAVSLVRAEVRPRERERGGASARVALVVLALAALALMLLGAAGSAVALLPRTLHAVTRAMAPTAAGLPNIVGARETAMLASVVLLLLMAAH